MRLCVLTFVLFIVITNFNYAKDTVRIKTDEDNTPNRFLGLSASTLSAFGISIHKITDSGISAIKINFCILPGFAGSSKNWIFFGGEFQNNIYKNSYSRFYVLGGIGYLTDYLTFGPAFGYELYSGKPGIAINFDVGVGFLKSLKFPMREIDLIGGIGLGLSYAY